MESESEQWGNFFKMAQEFKENSNTIYVELLEGGTRYTEPEFIARGGMKEVYSVKDNTTGRLVALTVLINEEAPDARESFLREARITAFLQHPNIMPVYDLGIDDGGTPFFTMKLNNGEGLNTILEKLRVGDGDYNARYSLQSIMQIFRKVCEAVAYAHSKGVIHLDIKPDNVQISDFGEVLLCDWGLGKITNRDIDAEESLMDMDALDASEISTMTQNDKIKGTPGYMAPEQIKVKYASRDERTDIYALGALLYSLLTYEVPISGRNLTDQLRKTIRGKIVAPRKRAEHANIPASLEAVCLKAMNRQPEKRYQNVNEMVAEVDSWQSGFATDAEDAGLFKQLVLIYKRNKIFVLSLIIFGMVFVSLMGGFIVIQGNLLTKLADKETVAQKALKNLQDERNNKEQLLLDKQLQQLSAALTVKNSALIRDIADKILASYPENRQALDALSMHYLFEAKIEKFMELSELAIDKKVQSIRSKIFPFYITKKNDKSVALSQDIMIFLKLRRVGYTKAGNIFIRSLLAQYHTDKSKSLFFNALLKHVNELDENLKVVYKTLDKGFSLDISGNKNLSKIMVLNSFNIRELNVANTGISSLDGLYNMDPRVLDVSNTNLKSFRFLKNLKLEKFIADHSNIKDLTSLKPYSLKSLSIVNTKIESTKSLTRVSNLEELIVDEKLYEKLPKKLLKVAKKK